VAHSTLRRLEFEGANWGLGDRLVETSRRCCLLCRGGVAGVSRGCPAEKVEFLGARQIPLLPHLSPSSSIIQHRSRIFHLFPTSMAATAMHQTVRRWALTGGITAITITGTIYGASLKSDQEQNKVRSCATLPHDPITYTKPFF
jgi:hypothetical protein